MRKLFSISSLFIVLGTTIAQDIPLELEKLFAELDTIQIESSFTININQPEFPGGMDEFYKYIYTNLKYPEIATFLKVEGMVALVFMILPDGTVDKESIRVVESPSEHLNAESIRLIANSPPWIPATRFKEGETPVPTAERMSSIIHFRIIKDR